MIAKSDSQDIREQYFATLARNDAALRSKIVDFVERNGQLKNLDRLVEGHITGRAKFFFNSIFPWIETQRQIGDAVVAEFGPGTGSTTVPLALKCRKVHAFDISPDSTEILRTRADYFPQADIELHVQDNASNLARLREIGPVDVVMMFAVLEHMKLQERLDALSAAWSVLSDGGIIVIGDTPNRLVYRHGHTSWMPFFDMLPIALWREYADQMPNTAFSDALAQWVADGLTDEQIDDKVDRWGRGFSYHELEVAIGPLRKMVASDGLALNLVRAMPILPQERHLMRFMRDEVPHVPLGFGRASLYLMLQKGNRSGGQMYHEDVVRALI